MERSESLSELAGALNKFQSEMGKVVFDSNNPFFKSKYASLSALVSTAKPILAKNGLSVSQLVSDGGSVTTMLLHSSGQFLSSTLTLKPVKEDPQGQGSAITYARRYAYASILGIVSDEDDDGNASTVGTAEFITEKQLSSILDLLSAKELKEKGLLDYMKVEKLENILAKDYMKVLQAINSAKKGS